MQASTPVIETKAQAVIVRLCADGWHIYGPFGEDVGPFTTKAAAEEFLDWVANRFTCDKNWNPRA